VPNAYKLELNEDGSNRHRWESNKQAEKNRITVQYSPLSNEWRVTNKNIIVGENIKADIEYGTSRINAYHILEQTLNLKDVVVKDKVLNHDGKEVDVINEDETTLAKQKQEDLKAAFRDWIFKDPNRREALVAIYNEKFNSIRPREYDGSHITFAGMNAEIKLEEHQVNAVARVMYRGNTLLAHEVCAGKSFEMIAAAMESKRIGLCSKSLITVPKHLTGQMASEFLRLYPNANILVATDKTFEKKNRKRFCSKIATGNYDAIIMGHTQFEMIPLSVENQERYYREQFDMLVEAIAEAKAADSGYFTVKQMENIKNKVKVKLDNLYRDGRKDDVITFEQLGVDKLFVDEAHSYKNCAKRCDTSCA
jgi:N12 class adenine-specific DNA methylase